jgi:hypothetical protein
MSQFWNTTAGPTTWDVLKIWDRTPRPLRLKPRPQPPAFRSWDAPERLTMTEAFEFTHFLRKYYAGPDWTLDPSEEWITNLLEDDTTLALVVRNELGDIVGSIVCRVLGRRMHLGSYVIPTAHVIEGLCIHPSWRGQHLAGWLIAWVDHLKNADGPQAFFWSREAMPRDLAYVASHTYGYVHLGTLAALGEDPATPFAFQEIPWSLFRTLWATKSMQWNLEEAAFPTHLPADPLRVWRIGEVYIVVSDTRRRTRDRGQSIWELQFMGTLERPLIGGGGGREQGRKMLEALGCQHLRSGILFVSSAAWQGGCTAAWPAPWVYGTAGVHTTYIYNYMPPAFHRLATLFLRNEL